MARHAGTIASNGHIITNAGTVTHQAHRHRSRRRVLNAIVITGRSEFVNNGLFIGGTSRRAGRMGR